jgi:hypothetical protein
MQADEPSARATQERQIGRFTQADQASTARGRQLPPYRALQTGPLPPAPLGHSGVRGFAAPQKGHSVPATVSTSRPAPPAAPKLRPSSRPSPAIQPQRHPNLSSRAIGSQSGSTGGSASSEKKRRAQLQPDQATSLRAGTTVRRRSSGVIGSQTHVTWDTAVARPDADPADVLWGLFEDWATMDGATDRDISASQSNTAGATAAPRNYTSTADPTWGSNQAWVGADKGAVQRAAGANRAAPKMAVSGRALEAGAAGPGSDPVSTTEEGQGAGSRQNTCSGSRSAST